MKALLVVLLVFLLTAYGEGCSDVKGQRYFDISQGECLPCQQTCGEEPRVCILLCTSGCGCPSGTMLDKIANACVEPDKCTPASCAGSWKTAGYTAEWTVRGDMISFEVTAVTTGWVGIGFSLDQKMLNSDVVVGASDGSGNSFIVDGFTFRRALPEKDNSSDLMDQSVMRNGGNVTLQFTRQRVTADDRDLSLDRCVYFLYAWDGRVLNYDSMIYSKHRSRFISPKLICLPNATVCPKTSCAGSWKTAGYTAEWTVRGDMISFEVTAVTTGWVGIGFSLDRKMPNSDVVVGASDGSGKSFIVDGFTLQHAIPEKDNSSDLMDQSVMRNGGNVTLQFTRQRVTADDRDLSLDRCVYFLYAWDGRVLDYDSMIYSKHRSRFISPKLICLPSATVCPKSCSDVKGQRYFDISKGECLPCQQTCGEEPRVCILLCTSGCGCPSGTMLDKIANACVEPDKCTCPPECDYNGKTYNAGDTFNSTDGCNTCTCSGDGRVSCTEAYCPSCSDVKGQRYFDISKGECLPCQQTCGEEPRACILLCTSGCGCPSGTMLDKIANACVEPDKCTPDSCAGSWKTVGYMAEWTVRGDMISFEVTAVTTGWVGIGFSLDQKMPNSDVVVGASDGSGNSFIVDGFTFRRALPEKDNSSDLMDQSVMRNGGNVTLQFTRQRVTADDRDLSLDRCVYFLYAWDGRVLDYDSMIYSKHRSRFISPKLICLPNATVCPKKCDYNGKTYNAGDAFNSTDGCNTCTCSGDGRVSCTKALCPKCCYNGQTYNPGVTFNSTDGCNTCTCLNTGAVACTRRACRPKTCDYNGKTYNPGDIFNSTDGCNTCTCLGDGRVSCTERACLPTCTHSLCQSERKACCSVPCNGGSKVTSCQACYYDDEERSVPKKCRYKCGENPEKKCLQKWAKCVAKKYKKKFEKTPNRQRTASLFKCAVPMPCEEE